MATKSAFRNTGPLIPINKEDRPQEPEVIEDPEPPKPPRVKRTFHMDKDSIHLLESYQTKVFLDTDVKPELSKIVSEAVRAYCSKT